LNIVITGCSKGIGAELVKLWSQDNMVFGISRDITSLNKLQKNLKRPSNFKFIAEDITKLTVNQLNNWISVDSIDILINNAGFLINKEFEKVDYEEYKKVMDINFWGPYHIIQLLIHKLSVVNGHIVNISSMGGVNYSSKFPGLSLYSSSKGALTILSECLAEELKRFNISVNALALGAVQTEMLNKAFPSYKAPTSAKEMAEYIIAFCESSNKILNGQIIKVSKSNP